MANEFVIKHGLISNGDIAAATSELSGQSLSITDGAIIHGNFTVSGTTFTTQHETVEITDNLLVINNGEIGPGVTVSGGLAGIEVDRGSSTNYRFVFDETYDNFRVGEVGDLQAVASREDSPTTNGVPFWNNTDNKFDTDAGFLFSGGKLGIGISPSYPLHLSYAPGDVSTYGVYLDMNPTGTHTVARHLYGISVDIDSDADESTYSSTLRGLNIDINSTGEINYLYGVKNSVTHDSTDTINFLYGSNTTSQVLNGSAASAYGVYSKVYVGSSGASSAAYGYYSKVQMAASTKTLSAAYGNYNEISQTDGTITTGYLYYGLYSGTVGTKWGIYLNGETKNYFSGSLGIGELSPAATLDVNGTLILQNGTTINEFSTDTTLSGNSDNAVPTEKVVKTYVDANSGGPGSTPGLVIRPKFAWKDANEVYIDAGVYHHEGTTEQMVYWDSQLTYTFISLGVSDWSYLYIDNSAIVTLGTNLLTVSELTDSTTEPTWSDSKHGWYNGSDRCIFAVRTDGSSNILEFVHTSDFVLYTTQIANMTGTDVDTTWINVTLTIPKFSTSAEILNVLFANGDTASCSNYWRTDGVAGTGYWVNWVDHDFNKRMDNVHRVITSTSQIIEVKHSVSGLQETAIYTDGWYFPTGM